MRRVNTACDSERPLAIRTHKNACDFCEADPSVQISPGSAGGVHLCSWRDRSTWLGLLCNNSRAVSCAHAASLERWPAHGGLPRQLPRWRGHSLQAQHHQLLRPQRAVLASPGAPGACPCAGPAQLLQQGIYPRFDLPRDSCGILCGARPLAAKPALCVLVTQSSGRLCNPLVFAQVCEIYAVEAHFPCRGSCGRAEAAGTMQV